MGLYQFLNCGHFKNCLVCVHLINYPDVRNTPLMKSIDTASQSNFQVRQLMVKLKNELKLSSV